MTRRSLFAALAALAVVAWVGNVTFAKDDANTHEGTVVSATDTKLTMTDKEGKEHSHDVGTTATISLDGKVAKLSELKKGDRVKVTMGADRKVSRIEATRKGGRDRDK
jgi:hypothetical protein